MKTPFKFVESIRKKADRDNLQGASCKLCKKFYDAVSVGNAQDMVECRCNHRGYNETLARLLCLNEDFIETDEY